MKKSDIHWLIQSTQLSCLQVNAVWYAANEAGCTTHEAVVIPFQDELDNAADLIELTKTNLVIPYGSCKLTKMTNGSNWIGHCYDENTFTVDAWNLNRDDMLNSDSTIVAVKDIDKHFTDIGVFDDDMYFIRPLHDLKQFNGTVTSAKEMRQWMSSVESGNFSFSEDTLTAIAPYKKIYNESRFFVVGGKVIDGSFYRVAGKMLPQEINDSETLNIAQKIADKWLPHQCCVMDLAMTDDGMKVIEFNTINSSGFYKHDISKIVNALTDWVFEQAKQKRE